jgi:hypothetical protein
MGMLLLGIAIGGGLGTSLGGSARKSRKEELRRSADVMSRDADLDALANRLSVYADSPLLERHRSIQNDLLNAAQAARDLAAVLRAYGGLLADGAKMKG